MSISRFLLHAARAFLPGCCALILIGCSSIFELRHTGDVLELPYAGEEIHCELLAVTDSMLYLIPTADNDPALGLVAGMIYEAPPVLFPRGEVQGYMNRSWLTPVLLFQLLPTVMLTIEAFDYDKETFGLNYMLPAIGVIGMINLWVFHDGSNDPPEFTRALTPEEMQLLRRYARYPQGLTAEQLELLLSVRKQTTPRLMPGTTSGIPPRAGS